MRRQLPVVVALVAGIAIALGAVAGLGGDDDPKTTAAATKGASAIATDHELKGPEGSFTLNYPDGWSEVDGDDLDASQGEAVAAIKRSSDDGVLIVQRAGRLEGDLDTVAGQLTTRLKKQIKGFRQVKSTQVDLPAGRALSYTFIRAGGGVQNLVVIPSGDDTFTLNSVVKGDSTDAAREVAAMVRAFEPKG